MGALQFGNLDAAIAQAEGYNTPGTIPNLANNPGDIIAGPFASAHGATGSITAAGGQQIATFPDPATGLSATDALVASKVASGATDINSLAQSWLGSNASPTDVSNYAGNIAGALTAAGTPASPSTALSSLTPAAAGGTSSSLLGKIASNVIGPNISFGRAGAFIVGLLFILGGILALKPAQNIVVNAGRKAASAVAV
jgi:hypothetical protein